jgi:hypothetical protein
MPVSSAIECENKVPALTTFAQSPKLVSLRIGNVRGWPLLFFFIFVYF